MEKVIVNNNGVTKEYEILFTFFYNDKKYITYTNYVIPIRTPVESTNGFCNFLEKEFGIVRNYSGRELQVLSDSVRQSDFVWGTFGDEGVTHPLDNAKLFGTNGTSYSYEKSIFRRIEIILENENMDEYSQDGKLIITPISDADIDHFFK